MYSIHDFLIPFACQFGQRYWEMRFGPFCDRDAVMSSTFARDEIFVEAFGTSQWSRINDPSSPYRQGDLCVRSATGKAGSALILDSIVRNGRSIQRPAR